MKKIIIALLVVLSVFALVSCSSNTTPIVKTENVTLTVDGNADASQGLNAVSWTKKLEHNNNTYGVWCKDASGKYYEVFTLTSSGELKAIAPSGSPVYLYNAKDEAIGILTANVKQYWENTVAGTTDSGVLYTPKYVYDLVTLKITGIVATPGSWNGEIAIATTAVSDTELAGVVAKYNVTFTNTADPVTPVPTYFDLGAVELASGGDYLVTDATKTVYYGDTQAVITNCAVFEQITGGYKYAGEVGSSDIALGTDKVGTFKVTSGVSASNYSFTFALTDARETATTSYKQFVDYKYAATIYVIGGYTLNEKNEKIYDGTPVVKFTLGADMPALKIFTYDAESPNTVELKDIEVAEADEHVGLYYVDAKGYYQTLNNYYVGEPTATEPGLAVGNLVVSESSSSQLERVLTVTFNREDAEGERKTKDISRAILSETIDAKLCSWTDEDDQKTFKELASLKMYFANEDSVDFSLTNDSKSSAKYWLNYYDDGGTSTLESLDKCYVYTYANVSATEKTWVEFNVTDGNCWIFLGKNKTQILLKAATADAGKSVVFTLDSSFFSVSSKVVDTVYVKFTKGGDTAATNKLAFECTAKVTPQ